MSNIGRVIRNGYCNGFAGRRYDLDGAKIEIEASDYIIIRTINNEPVFIGFFDIIDNEYESLEHIKQEYIDSWVEE